MTLSALKTLRHVLFAAGFAAALSSCATQKLPVNIEQRRVIDGPALLRGGLALKMSVANISNWNETEIIDALGNAANILAQCGVQILSLELLRISVPDYYRYFETSRSRELARTLQLQRPVIYFTAGTRQVPAFDAEAIGRGNSRSRPELADSVWIARGARDLGIVVAHELAHVLMDSGAHDNTPGNLMAESTTQDNTRLTAEQCARMRDTGTRNALLHPGVN